MELEVLKTFNGKDEGKLFHPGDKFTTDNIERINILVGGGYAKINAVAKRKGKPKEDEEETSIGETSNGK